ncbi:hypothetical protein BRDID11002_15240 [Bradyrhizobium diazoefficiens]
MAEPEDQQRGSSAIFGIGNSAEMKVMPTLRASRDSANGKADGDAGRRSQQPADTDAQQRGRQVLPERA